MFIFTYHVIYRTSYVIILNIYYGSKKVYELQLSTYDAEMSVTQ